MSACSLKRLKNYGLFFLLLLSACGPQFKTRYTYTPPHSEDGAGCVNNCETIKRLCIERENSNQRECEQRSQDEVHDCESHTRWSEGREPKWYECSGEVCTSTLEGCDEEYRACYENCGGTVKAITECVANCEQLNAKQN